MGNARTYPQRNPRLSKASVGPARQTLEAPLSYGPWWQMESNKA